LLSNKEKYVKSVDDLISMYTKANKNTIDLSDEIAKTSNAIKKTRSKQDKLLDLYTDDEIDKADYLEKNNRLKAEAEKLNQQLATLNEEQSISNDTDTRLNKVKEFFATISDNNEGAIKVAQEMLESVTILKGSTKKEMKIRITMRYGDIIPCTLVAWASSSQRERPAIIMFSNTEVSPLVGSEKQSEDLIAYINQEMLEDPSKIWELNMFGKSMHEMVRDGLQNKLFRMPETAQMKFQDTLQRIINEGSGGLICIIL